MTTWSCSPKEAAPAASLPQDSVNSERWWVASNYSTTSSRQWPLEAWPTVEEVSWAKETTKAEATAVEIPTTSIAGSTASHGHLRSGWLHDSMIIRSHRLPHSRLTDCVFRVLRLSTHGRANGLRRSRSGVGGRRGRRPAKWWTTLMIRRWTRKRENRDK
jgi:hypothetical protein